MRKLKGVFFLAILVLTGCSGFTQVRYSPYELGKKLSDKSDIKNEAFFNTLNAFTYFDSAIVFNYLDSVSAEINKDDYYSKARFDCMKAALLRIIDMKNLPAVKSEVEKLYAEAMQLAYESSDDYLKAFVSSQYGRIYVFGEVGLSVMYTTNGMELYDKLHFESVPEDYRFLAEVLYKVKEYKNSIYYAQKAVNAWQNSKDSNHFLHVSCINTVALGYHRQKIYDSAFYYYNRALKKATEIDNKVWVGIVSGNMAQIYYDQGNYEKAKPLFELDSRTSNEAGVYDNAANSMQWLARTEAALGNIPAAKEKLQKAFNLLKQVPDVAYLKNSYLTGSIIFQAAGNYDSAYYYYKLYSTLNDSLEKIVNTSSVSISKARLNDKISQHKIQNLNRDKRSQILLRNMIIAGIIIASILALLLVNRNRLKTKLKMEKAEQEKMLMNQEILSAKEQLQMFTQNVLEKNTLIENLQEIIKSKQHLADRQSLINDLSNQTILTEAEWIKFKLMFEKTYPDFFAILKSKYPEITIAEQRMAALIYVQLATKQIASMLGISPDSVHKTRQRLRQRLGINADTDLEQYIASI